jgi:hypothetical protein
MSVVPRIADEADLGSVLAAEAVGPQAAYPPGPHGFN